MNNSPKVSILVPVYNRAKIILETLNSAVNQTYENIEVIIVDNKSTDNTFEIVREFAKSYSNVTVYQNEENIGPVRNWQKCLEYSSGEFIKILFSDDWIEKTFVEKCMKILLAHEDVGFVYTKTYITDDDKKYSYINDIEGKKEREYFVSESIKIPYGKTPLSPGCALFRKEDVVIENNIPNSLSLDHENTGAGIDLLIYLNSLKKYKYCYCTSNTIAYFRKHKGSITVKERDTIWKYYFTALLYYIRKEDITDRVYDLRVSVLKSFTLKDFIRSNKLLESYGFDDCSINKWDLIWIAVEKSKTIAGTIRDVLNKDRTVGC